MPTTQFAVTGYCPTENPDDGHNDPLEPAVWVNLPGRRNVPNYQGPQCDGVHYRVARDGNVVRIGGYVCEHMGHLIE